MLTAAATTTMLPSTTWIISSSNKFIITILLPLTMIAATKYDERGICHKNIINSSINSPQQYLSHQIITSTHYENGSIAGNDLLRCLLPIFMFDVDNIAYHK